MTVRTRRLGRLSAVTCALLLALPVVAALPVLAQPAGGSAEAGTSLEAWYRTSPVGGEDDPLCATPAGCPAAPVSPAPPYPDGTLHVGATSGRPDAVTYVAFDTSILPAGAELTGGTAVFPVAGVQDGSVAAETAELQACLVGQPFEPAQGAPAEEAPAPDCAVPVPATYVAEGEVPSFEVDLTRFAAAWGGIGAIAGLALVPADGATGTWHVAFSGREREQEASAPPITALLTYREAAADSGAGGGFGSSLFPDPPSGSSGSSGSGFDSSSSPFSSGFQSAPSSGPAVAAPQTAAPGGADPAPQVAAPETVTGQPVAALVAPGAYPYPVVWLLPLALALGAVVLSRALTGEVEVLADDDERDLIARLWLAFFPERGPRRGASR